MEFIDKEINEALEQELMAEEMATVRGNRLPKDLGRIRFSFYFSAKVPKHSIRVKVTWSPSKFKGKGDGYLKLHGNYEYVQSSDKDAYKPSEREIVQFREFCKKYKVLFAAVWEKKLDETLLVDYFHGSIPLSGLLTHFVHISGQNKLLLSKCSSVKEVEDCVRNNKIFNMND